MYILIWIILAFIIAYYGGQRKIGFPTALLVSLILSPFIGLICVALSEAKSNDGGQNNTSDHSKNEGFDIEQFRGK
jgi:amino acid transporter